MMDQLDVYLHDTKAGVLISDKGRMEFCYSPAYIEKPEAEPLAFSLPVRSEPYHGDAITPFFPIFFRTMSHMKSMIYSGV